MNSSACYETLLSKKCFKTLMRNTFLFNKNSNSPLRSCFLHQSFSQKLWTIFSSGGETKSSTSFLLWRKHLNSSSWAARPNSLETHSSSQQLKKWSLKVKSWFVLDVSQSLTSADELSWSWWPPVDQTLLLQSQHPHDMLCSDFFAVSQFRVRILQRRI